MLFALNSDQLQPAGRDLLTTLAAPLGAYLKTRDELLDATHALDRVLMHGYYAVPQWYSTTHRIAYKRTLAYPQTLPLYYSAEGWVVSTWWAKPDH